MEKSYETLATAIIKEQERVMGPIAWSEANKVGGITVKEKNINLQGEGKKILESLVRQYETLFGRASIEACKDAVRPLLSKVKVDIPSILS